MDINSIKQQIIVNGEEKKSELEQKAKAETKWYKKVSMYVCAGVTAIVVELINLYGDQLLDAIRTFIG